MSFALKISSNSLATSVGVTKPLNWLYFVLFTSMAARIRPLLFLVDFLHNYLTHSLSWLILVIISSFPCFNMLSQCIPIPYCWILWRPQFLQHYSVLHTLKSKLDIEDCPHVLLYYVNHLLQPPFYCWSSLSCFQCKSQVSAYIFAGFPSSDCPIPKTWLSSEFQ